MIRNRTPFIALVLTGALVLASCGGDDGTDSPPPANSAPDMTDDMTDMSDMSDDMSDMSDDMTDMTDDMSELAAWQTMTITDVDGLSFTLADYVGTPVLVETFATWCSNCRSQLRRTQDAAAALGDHAVVIALSVETDLAPSQVADYARQNQFSDIRFAVISPEMLAALADSFGTSIANPPGTPKFVIDASGHHGSLSTGSASTEVLVAELRDAAAA